MTGGDYALIRSVESFEDYAEFGRRQARKLGVTGNDILIAITEGGETSSVLGTVDEAVDNGAEVFLLFNNPADILREHIERSRKAIEDKRVTVLDLYCGPMAIAGSTRMQATTSEQLVAGNWMSWVEVSNKKLRDRGIRLISELCSLSYRDACYALHETLVELEQTDFSDKAKPSPVQYTVKKLMR